MTTPAAVSTHPYEHLTPDVVLDALESVGKRGDGRLLTLNSYENRVYQIWLEDDSVVVAKFYRPARWTREQIAEEHEFAASLADNEIPMVAPLAIEGRTLFHFAGFDFAVFPRRGGRAPELENPEVLEWIGRFIGRIHLVGRTRKFTHRPSLDIETFGRESRTWLLGSGMIPTDLLPAWKSVVDLALEGVEHAWERAGAVEQIRLHGDCHAGNMLWTEDGPHFVDLDDSRSGPAVQDLWMLLAGDRAAMTRQMSDVLAGYEDFAEFDHDELVLIEPLRTLRLLHYSAWLGRRWDDPAFPAAFPWFNTARYWQDRILEMREQVAAMQEPALGPL